MDIFAITRLSLIETLRRKEFYVVLVLVLGLAIWMHMMNVGLSGAGRFAKDIVMQVVWLASFALAVPLATRQISSDLEHKTVYVLASRPIPRWHYVFGRTLGAVVASLICFTAFYAVLLLMLLAKGAATITDSSLWQAYFLQVMALVMLCCVTVLFSVTATPSGAVTFSLLILAMMRYGGPAILNRIEQMSGFVREVAWFIFLILPHFEFFSMSQRVVHGWGALPIGLFLEILAYGAAYSLVITALAALTFRRRWL